MASRPVRILLKVLLAALILVVLLVGGVFIALQTGPVKRAIAGFAADAVGGDMHLTVEGLNGLLPLSIQLDRVAVAESADAEPWLVARHIALEWSPLDLLSGNLHVDLFSAEEVVLAKLPPSGEEPPPQEPGPVWPPPSFSLPKVQLDRLAIERFDMGEPVLGQAAVYSVHGKAQLGGGQANVDLAVTRLDGPASALQAVIATRGVDTGSPELDVDITMKEPPGGLLAAATDIDQTAPIGVTLQGKGPLSDWTGALNATHGEAHLAALDLSLAMSKESLGFGVDGSLIAAPLVGGPEAPGLASSMLSEAEREAVRELGERIDLALDGRWLLDDGGQVQGLELARADVTAGSLGVEARGRIGKSLQDMELDALAHVEDLAVLNTLLDQRLEGSLVLLASINRKDDALQGHAEVTLEHFAYEEYRAQNAKLTLDFDPLKDEEAWTLDADQATLPPARGELVVDVNGLEVPPGMESVVQAVGDSPRITGSFRTVDSRTVRIERVDLAAIAAEATVQGQVSLDGPAETHVEIVAADLQNTAEVFGMADAGLDGAMTLELDFNGNWSEPSGRLTFDAQTQGLVVDAQNGTDSATPPGALAAVLGDEPAFSGEAVLEPSGALQVTDLKATGRAFSLQGSANAHLKDDQAPLAVNMDIAAPSLEPFSGLAGMELGGALNLSVQGSGDMGAPDITLNLSIDEPRVDGQAFDNLRVAVDGSGPLESWAGTASIDLAATVEGQPAALDVDTRFTLGNEQIALRNLVIRGPGVALDGDVTVHQASGVVTGSLAGGAEDLGKLGAFAGVELGGSLQTSIALREDDGNQGVELTATLDNVQAPGAAIGNAQIEAQLANLTGTPQGTARVAANNISAEGFSAETLTLTADGSGSSMDITLQVDGSIAAGAEPAPLQLTLAGNLQPPGDEPLSFRLTELTGSLDERPLQLEQPGTVTFAGGDLAIEPLAIKWGQATLAAQGGWSGPKADLSLEISDLLLDSVMLLTGSEPIGPEAELSLKLDVTGNKSNPTATLDVTTRSMRLRVAEESPLSAMEEFTLNAQARLGDGSLQATATVEGQQDSQVRLEATLPATFSLEPFAFELPPDGTLSGSLQADANLASFEPILAFYGVQASGQFQADFTLQGRLDKPAIDGKATISNGRIEYVETGSVVNELELEFVAAKSPENESPRLVINLTAGDGENGSVKMSGWVDVDPQRDTPFRINVALAKFTAVRMDSLRLAATGDAALEGDMAESRIVGGLSLAPVQVWLPDKLPPDVVEVEVVNVRTLNTVRGADGEEEIIDDPDEPDESAAEPAAFDPKLELGVEVKDGMRVQGLGVVTTWKGRFDVGGRLTAPKLTGKVEVTDGHIDFLGKRFDIRKGVLNFWGRTPPSPRVEVEATIDAGDVLAIIRVHGSANSPQFSLASEPSRPRDEILSYILFGQDLNRVSPVQAVKIAQTAAMLASGSDFLSMQRNASKLPLLGGLDIGLTDTEDGGALAVGTEVVKDVHVNVEEGLSGSSTEVEVEVDVSKQFSVHGTVDDKGDQSVGFDWKLDY